MDLQEHSSHRIKIDAAHIGATNTPGGQVGTSGTDASATAIGSGSDDYLITQFGKHSQRDPLDDPETLYQATRVSNNPPIIGKINRAIDVLLSATLLVLLLPFLLVVSLTIFLLDPGPVFFKHRRIGRNGQTFDCIKFRTMFVGAEERLAHYLANDRNLQRQWAADRKLNPDPRVTPIGRILRPTSIDELPQLINVLRGEMSLVGPRPIVGDEVPSYGRYIKNYLSVRPGLTGLWQVSGRNDTSYRRRVAMDVLYSRKVCVMLNLSILVATIPAVVLGRGAS